MPEQLELGWARAWAIMRPATDPKLRQGAWYPVLDIQRNHVALRVHGKRVTVHPSLVEIRRSQPARITVVYRGRSGPNPARGTSADLGTIYGVCPRSGDRVKLFENASLAECPRCGFRGEVAWWETG